MSHALAPARLRLATVLLLLVVAASAFIVGFSASSATAENLCKSGELCAWTETFYNGSEYFLACPNAVAEFFPEARSAKNRCGYSVELGWEEGGVINWKVCMNPGGERPEPGRFNRARSHSGAC